MFSHSRQPHLQGDQRTGQSVHCYQSVWMARLAHTNSSSSPQGQNGLSLSLMSNINGDANKFTEITGMRTIRILNEGVAATESLDCQPFPMLNAYQNIRSKNGLDNIPRGKVSHPRFGFKMENNGIRTVRQFRSVLGSREHVFEKVSQCHEEPTMQMIPYRSNKGKAQEVSFVERHENATPLALVSTSEKYLSNDATMSDTNSESNLDLRNFSILGRDKKWDDHSTSGEFGNSFLRRCNASFAGEPSKKRNLPCSDFFPSQITTVKETKAVILSRGGYEFQRMPGPIRDMEKIEIFNGNSMDGDGATFSKTTRNLLYLENANNNKNKHKAGVNQSSSYSYPKKNTFSQLLGLSPPLSLGRKGVEIELLDSVSDSQDNHDVREILNHGVSQKNESSAETATMDMDVFKQLNNFSGVNYSTSNKNLSVGHDLPSQATIASDRKKVKSKRVRTRLLDMNEIPVLQVSSSSMDNPNPSTSRTQSLDAEHLFHYESPTNNPNRPPTIEPISAVEPSRRWLKRLKLSAPHSCGVGTKNSNFEESLSHPKVNKLFREVMGGRDTCSFGKPLSNKYNGKNDSVANKSAIVPQKIESPPKKDLDNLLSHSWIKRWCRVSTQKKKVEPVVVCEPQSTKMDFNELQHKQFPSIGAMALMGKALTGFQPCEFRDRGSFVVWNTKGL